MPTLAVQFTKITALFFHGLRFAKNLNPLAMYLNMLYDDNNNDNKNNKKMSPVYCAKILQNQCQKTTPHHSEEEKIREKIPGKNRPKAVSRSKEKTILWEKNSNDQYKIVQVLFQKIS